MTQPFLSNTLRDCMTHYIAAVVQDENTNGEQRNNDEIVTGPPPALKTIALSWQAKGSLTLTAWRHEGSDDELKISVSMYWETQVATVDTFFV